MIGKRKIGDLVTSPGGIYFNFIIGIVGEKERLCIEKFRPVDNLKFSLFDSDYLDNQCILLSSADDE